MNKKDARIKREYLRSLLRHKKYVFQAGRVIGVPLWRLIVHDWQKFTRWEFEAYAHNYHGERTDAVQEAYTYAWLHHENTAPHHWGYWIPRSGRAAGEPLQMPTTYVKEMVADWHGAGRAYNESWDISGWLAKAGPDMAKRMHTHTIWRVMDVMGAFYVWNTAAWESKGFPTGKLSKDEQVQVAELMRQQGSWEVALFDGPFSQMELDLQHGKDAR